MWPLAVTIVVFLLLLIWWRLSPRNKLEIMLKRALLILAMLLSTACSWSTDSESAIGRVNDVKGNPRLFRGHRYLELGPDSNIEIHDSIITGLSDKLQVTLRDGTIVRVGQDSELTIQEYSGRARPARLRLTSSGGQYRVTTGKLFRRDGSSLEIGTPVVTIRSGSADLLVEHAVDAGTLTVVQLGSDSIRIKNQFGETELLHQGEMSTISFGLLPSQPAQIEKSELDAAIESTSLLIRR